MSSTSDLVVGTVGKAALPWLGSVGLPWILLACVMALAGTGSAGMYLGYEIAAGRHASDVAALKDAQIEALKVRTDQYLGAIARGDEIANRFEQSLANIRIENKTFTTEVVKETEKQVYIDCKLPETGMDLLRRRIDAANARILTGETRKEPK